MFNSKLFFLAASLTLVTPAYSATSIMLTGAGPGGSGVAVPGMNSAILFSSPGTGVPSNTAINYGGLVAGNGGNPYSASVGTRYTIAPMAGHFKNLHAVNFVGSGNFTVTLYQNGNPTTLKCELNGTPPFACDDAILGDAVAVAQGDKLTWRLCPYVTGTALGTGCVGGAASAPTGSNQFTISALFVADSGADAGNHTPLFSGEQNAAPSTSAISYGGFGGNTPTNATEAVVSTLIEQSGTVDQLCALATADPATTAKWDIRLFHNGALATNGLSTSIVAGTTQSCIDTGTPESISPGDTISVMICPSQAGSALGTGCTGGTAAPAAATIAWGVRFNPSVNGLQPLPVNGGVVSGAATRYLNASGATGVGDATNNANASMSFPTLPAGATNWVMANYVMAWSTDPGATKTRTNTLQSASSTLPWTFGATAITATMNSGDLVTYQGGTNPGKADASHTVNFPAGSAASITATATGAPTAVTWYKQGATLQAQ